jgi:hypothetical protein
MGARSRAADPWLIGGALIATAGVCFLWVPWVGLLAVCGGVWMIQNRDGAAPTDIHGRHF